MAVEASVTSGTRPVTPCCCPSEELHKRKGVGRKEVALGEVELATLVEMQMSGVGNVHP